MIMNVTSYKSVAFAAQSDKNVLNALHVKLAKTICQICQYNFSVLKWHSVNIFDKFEWIIEQVHERLLLLDSSCTACNSGL